MTTLRSFLLIIGFSLAGLNAALAAPALKSQINVIAQVVTVGDMFSDAGPRAEQALFLAPAPGTSGFVDLADVRAATAKIGLTEFDDQGATRIRVSRLATIVDEKLLGGLMTDDLKSRGILNEGMTAQSQFDTRLNGVNAAAVANPVQLVNLRYLPESGAFSARFTVAGREQPLDVSGHLDLMIAAPQLVGSLPAGAILKASDIEMRQVPLKLAETTGPALLDQLVGKQLLRQSRAGMVLRVTDVAEPQLVGRNDQVTVYLHSGPLTLTVKGTALNAASLGQPVAVLNLMSKKMLHGIARADGAVEIPVTPVTVAGL